MQTIHSNLTAFATPFNRALGVNAPSLLLSPQLPFGLKTLNGMIEYRAATDAYSNAFLFMFFCALPAFAFIWLMRRPAYSGGAPKKVEAAAE